MSKITRPKHPFDTSLFHWFQDPAGIFELIEVVGNGTYGQVYKVCNNKPALYFICAQFCSISHPTALRNKEMPYFFIDGASCINKIETLSLSLWHVDTHAAFFYLYCGCLYTIKFNIKANESNKLTFFLQGRHTKTGQLAAIKVMDVTEVILWQIAHFLNLFILLL
jgi:hypothetical protein